MAKGEQVPQPLGGDSVRGIDDADVENLYAEARKTFQAGAYTTTAMACRKLIQNIAVSKGAAAGGNYKGYVDWLVENHYVPPGSEKWVDEIRQLGNEANHEIPQISSEDAEEILIFTGGLLKFNYEMRARYEKRASRGKT